MDNDTKKIIFIVSMILIPLLILYGLFTTWIWMILSLGVLVGLSLFVGLIIWLSDRIFGDDE